MARSEVSRREARAQSMPGPVRALLFAVLAAVLAGALYLIAVRGEALLFDLTALSQRVFCF